MYLLCRFNYSDSVETGFHLRRCKLWNYSSVFDKSAALNWFMWQDQVSKCAERGCVTGAHTHTHTSSPKKERKNGTIHYKIIFSAFVKTQILILCLNLLSASSNNNNNNFWLNIFTHGNLSVAAGCGSKEQVFTKIRGVPQKKLKSLPWIKDIPKERWEIAPLL